VQLSFVAEGVVSSRDVASSQSPSGVLQSSESQLSGHKAQSLGTWKKRPLSCFNDSDLVASCSAAS